MTQRRMNFFESADIHQLRPVQHPSLLVTVTKSDNPYFDYPVTGVLHMVEVGTDLQVSKAVFHELLDDGRLGPPCTMDGVEFTYARMSLNDAKKPSVPVAPAAPATDADDFEAWKRGDTSEYCGYTVKPKLDMNGWGVSHGWNVIKDHCLALPAGTWARSQEEALMMIDVFVAAEEDGKRFWGTLRAIQRMAKITEKKLAAA